jgi:hypothetical protein
MRDTSVRAYKEIEKHQVYTLTDPYSGRERVATVGSSADLINKLSQLSGGTLIFDGDPTGAVLDTSKAEFIARHFDGQKIAILYRYQAEGQLLRFMFKNHTEIPEEFNDRTDLTFIAQIQSAREGVNLSSADALVMYNIDFSATSYFQARARIQTKDRTAPANLYWIFSKHGIERKVYAAVSDKKNYTYSYYAKHDRGRTSSPNQKSNGGRRVAGPPTDNQQHGGMAGSVLLQEWPDLFHRSEAARE